MKFPYKIVITTNKNAYIKISNEGEIIFQIPKRYQSNQNFFQILEEKAEKLRKKYQSRPKIEKRNDQWILIFWEFVEWNNVIATGKPKSDKKIENLLKEILLEYITEYVKIFTEKIGLQANKIIIKKSKTKRWSCSYDQNLMFNLSLIFLPWEKIQYVVAHEVAHLKEKNHQKDFWNLVKFLFPKYKKVRNELKNLIIL